MREVNFSDGRLILLQEEPSLLKVCSKDILARVPYGEIEGIIQGFLYNLSDEDRDRVVRIGLMDENLVFQFKDKLEGQFEEEEGIWWLSTPGLYDGMHLALNSKLEKYSMYDHFEGGVRLYMELRQPRLKECPRCKFPFLLVIKADMKLKPWRIMCKNCGNSTGWFFTRETAEHEWNAIASSQVVEVVNTNLKKEENEDESE